MSSGNLVDVTAGQQHGVSNRTFGDQLHDLRRSSSHGETIGGDPYTVPACRPVVSLSATLGS
jgi:hypothetical protein